jgi:anti-sigma regulatory factor (Ser/Thr protein kinase)
MQLLPVDDLASVGLVRLHVRTLAASLGFDDEATEAAAIVASELGHNQLRHGRLGEIALRTLDRGGVAGIEIDAMDAGDGFSDPVNAFRGQRGPSEHGLGIGLAGVRRLAAEVDVDTRAGEHARVVARAFAGAVPWRTEVAVVGRPYPGEHISGDDAVFVRTGNRVVVALADGLGHGQLARDASAAACAFVRANAERSALEIVDGADAALRATRGAALAVVVLDVDTDQVDVCIAGNVRVGLYAPGLAKRFPYVPRIVGSGRGRRLRSEQHPRQGRALVMFSDGLPEGTDPSDDRPGTTGWPLPLAWRLVAEQGRDNDDVTVLALR